MTHLILLSKSSARQLAAKYFYVLQMGIQNTLVYRFNFLCRAVFNLVPLIAMIALWQTIYAGRGEKVPGYTITQMICYYLLVIIIDAFFSPADWCSPWRLQAPFLPFLCGSRNTFCRLSTRRHSPAFFSR